MISKTKNVDWVVIILLPILVAVLAQLFNLSLLVEVLMFFGLPPAYLYFRNPKIVPKTLMFSLIAWWPLTIVWEYLAYRDLTWFVPSSYRFISSSLPLEDIPWGILFLVYGTAVWEHFFNDSKHVGALFPKRYLILVTFLYLKLFVFLALYFTNPQILYLPYFFLWLGVLFCVLPPLVMVFAYPKITSKLVGMSFYFFIPFSLMDFTAITQKEWWFPGTNFIYVINFFGSRLPVEEVLFFWVLCMPALACWYEFFADDGK